MVDIEYYDIVVEHMSHVQEVVGSNPAGYRAFFFCPLLSHASLDWCSFDDSQKIHVSYIVINLVS